MRELKFRIWQDNKGYLDIAHFDRGVLIATNGIFSMKVGENDSIELYTGIKDKNGKEIYEGDILREKGLLSLTYLEWDKNHARYKTKVLDESKHVSSIFDFDIIDALECEVIGNIHENPELLEHKG